MSKTLPWSGTFCACPFSWENSLPNSKSATEPGSKGQVVCVPGEAPKTPTLKVQSMPLSQKDLTLPPTNAPNLLPPDASSYTNDGATFMSASPVCKDVSGWVRSSPASTVSRYGWTSTPPQQFFTTNYDTQPPVAMSRLSEPTWALPGTAFLGSDKALQEIQENLTSISLHPPDPSFQLTTMQASS